MKVTPLHNYTFRKTINQANTSVAFGTMPLPKMQKDVFVRQLPRVKVLTNGVDMINLVAHGNGHGTTCENAIMMTNFKSLFSKEEYKNICKKGLSTNRFGVADAFLKAKSEVPLSTSFVHSCSLMYLYNHNTKTHALYHSIYNCPLAYMDFMVKTLMPEGFTHGIIAPGGAHWAEQQGITMINLFSTMKSNNPQSIVNVFTHKSLYPEIVGYGGRLFEIPNERIAKDIKAKRENIYDYGQASFQIMDIQGQNTFNVIVNKMHIPADFATIKSSIENGNYNEEMKNVLRIYTQKREKNILKILSAKTFDELVKIRDNMQEDYRMYRETYFYVLRRIFEQGQ